MPPSGDRGIFRPARRSAAEQSTGRFSFTASPLHSFETVLSEIPDKPIACTRSSTAGSRRVETPLSHASRIVATSAFSDVCRGSRKPEKLVPCRSFGTRRFDEPSRSSVRGRDSPRIKSGAGYAIGQLAIGPLVPSGADRPSTSCPIRGWRTASLTARRKSPRHAAAEARSVAGRLGHRGRRVGQVEVRKLHRSDHLDCHFFHTQSGRRISTVFADTTRVPLLCAFVIMSSFAQEMRSPGMPGRFRPTSDAPHSSGDCPSPSPAARRRSV